MQLAKSAIQEHNQPLLSAHKKQFDFVAEGKNDLQEIIQKLTDFQIAIPSWALGSGGICRDSIREYPFNQCHPRSKIKNS